MKTLFLFVFALLMAVHFVKSAVGPYTLSSGSVYTTYYERTILLMANSFRVAPLDYLNKFSLATSNCANGDNSARQPIYWNGGLTSGARYQCTSMKNSNPFCFQHDTCPGYCNAIPNGSCSWADRIRFFYKQTNEAIGENVAWGLNDVTSVMDGWIQSTGHCENLLSASYNEAGVSFVAPFACQDFGGAMTLYRNPIVVGSHFFPQQHVVSLARLQFGVVYSSGAWFQAAAKVQLILNGVARTMTLDFGSANLGTYIYKPNSQEQTAISKGCVNYVFKATDTSGNVYTFPEAGSFSTQYVSGCTVNYST